MTICTLCGEQIQIDKYLSRKSTCPKCGRDLRICLNCRFYSETSHNRCLEIRAEFQRSRDRANFCDYFTFKESGFSSSSKEKEDALSRLDELFKKQ